MSAPTPETTRPGEPSDAAPAPTAARCLRCWIVFVTIVVAVTAADLWIKAWAFETVAGVPVVLSREAPPLIPRHQPIVIVPHVLNLALTTNSGAVFGLGKGGQPVFLLVSLVATVAVLLMFVRSRRDAWLTHVCLALVLGGAWGNMYDRMVFNVVRDMFWMLPTTRLWPWIFNFADACLVVGVPTLMFIFWRSEQPRQIDQKAPS